MTVGLPEEVVARLRSLALDRVARLEAGWDALMQSPSDATVAAELRRELHTLKGDARIVGFTDVNLLCHKLEDALAFAQQRRYEVAEDFQIVVGMGFGFLALLLRAKAGLGGLDLPGFIVTLDQVLSEEQSRSPSGRFVAPGEGARASRPSAGGRASTPPRAGLATVATDVYLAFLAAGGDASAGVGARLHRAWRELRRQLSAIAETSLASHLERHAFAARELARTLDKDVEITFDLGEVRVPLELANALDVALLHALRNAVDHGIETSTDRTARGKCSVASIVVRAVEAAESIEVVVEDDGRGIDFDQVRRRAKELGLLPLDASEASLIELLFRPGFSTTRRVTDLSGRGVGLDAARAAVARLGGVLTLAPRPEGGTRVSMRFERTGRRVKVHPLVARAGVKLAVTTQWNLTPNAETTRAQDPLEAIGLGAEIPRQMPRSSVLLRRDDRTIHLLATYAGATVTAERPCHTPETHPCEVVSVDGIELLLIRPEALNFE